MVSISPCLNRWRWDNVWRPEGQTLSILPSLIWCLLTWICWEHFRQEHPKVQPLPRKDTSFSSLCTPKFKIYITLKRLITLTKKLFFLKGRHQDDFFKMTSNYKVYYSTLVDLIPRYHAISVDVKGSTLIIELIIIMFSPSYQPIIKAFKSKL